MLKYPNFPGLRSTDCTEGAHSEGFIAPQTSYSSYSWWQGDSMPIPNNPTSVLGLSTSPRFYVSGFNPLQSRLLSTVNMIIILLIHNNAYSYLPLSCILILKRSQLTILTLSKLGPYIGVAAHSKMPCPRQS